MQMEAATSPLLPMADHLDPQRGVGSSTAVTDLEPLIRGELALILESRVFRLSMRMKRFLRFVVETTLEGRADCLKEYVIGTEVYDRKPPYAPSQDSIVRTEARRLRGKLKEYYEAEGGMDPLIISFRSGSYVPVFETRERINSKCQEAEGTVQPDCSALQKVLVIVMLLNDASGDIVTKDCARAISESIALQLTRSPNHKPAADLPPRLPKLALVKEPAPQQRGLK